MHTFGVRFYSALLGLILLPEIPQATVVHRTESLMEDFLLPPTNFPQFRHDTIRLPSDAEMARIFENEQQINEALAARSFGLVYSYLPNVRRNYASLRSVASPSMHNRLLNGYRPVIHWKPVSAVTPSRETMHTFIRLESTPGGSLKIIPRWKPYHLRRTHK